MMGRRQKLIDALEMDVIYAKGCYCYTINTPSIVKYAKRKMNKRYRKQLNFETKEELNLEREEAIENLPHEVQKELRNEENDY
jgi:hypothetical protein